MKRSRPKRLTLVGGWPGSGKSFLTNDYCNRVGGAVVHLDKDVCTSAFAESILVQNELAPTDRESHYYLSRVRPLEYQQLGEMASSLLSTGLHVIVTAPFFIEFANPKGTFIEALPADAMIERLWVHADPDVRRKRLINRNAGRDAWKLANWDAYLQESPSQPAPDSIDYCINNSAESQQPLKDFTCYLETRWGHPAITRSDLENIYFRQTKTDN